MVLKEVIKMSRKWIVFWIDAIISLITFAFAVLVSKDIIILGCSIVMFILTIGIYIANKLDDIENKIKELENKIWVN